MAVGFTPKHTETISIDGLTQQQFIALTYETAIKIEWKVAYISANGLIAYTDYGMFSRNAEIKITLEGTSAEIQSASTGSEMVDWGKNKENITYFIQTLETLKQTLSAEELDKKYEELKEQLISEEEDILKLPPPTTTEKISGFFSIFKPQEGFFITPILIDLNILIFIIMAFCGVNIMLPDNESLLKWGANFRPVTLNGEWWRLITSSFLHIGIFHLLMNMYALLYIGILLEPHLGKGRFILAYLLTAVTGSIASLWWHDFTISAGASGAIFGMYGVFLAMLSTNLIEKTARKTLLASIAIFVGYNLLNGLKGGIDNAGHLGGLFGGLIIGYGLIPSLKKPQNSTLKYSTSVLLSIALLAFSFFVFMKTPNDIGVYQNKMQVFVSKESKALEIYSLPENTSNDTILYKIKNTGIPSWKENIALMDQFEKMNLPLEIRMRNNLLREYCALRIKSYELLYKSISENTDQYNSEIENCTKQIDSTINKLEEEQAPKD